MPDEPQLTYEPSVLHEWPDHGGCRIAVGDDDWFSALAEVCPPGREPVTRSEDVPGGRS